MTSQSILIEGIAYYTLLEPPPSPSPSPKPPVLLCHALMSSLHMWDSTIPSLHAAGYTTLRFDHIGHGQTPRPSSSFPPNVSLDDLVRHAHLLVRAATHQPLLSAFIGCSIGGVLALRYAMLYPSSVAKTLSVCAPGLSVLEDQKRAWAERVALFEKDVRDGTEELCVQTVRRWIPGEEGRDVRAREEALGQVRGCSLEGYRVLVGVITGYGFEEEWRGWEGRVEGVVVAAGRDGASSVEGLRDVASRMEGLGFVCLEEAGHLPPVHCGEEFNRVVREVLDG